MSDDNPGRYFGSSDLLFCDPKACRQDLKSFLTAMNWLDTNAKIPPCQWDFYLFPAFNFKEEFFR